MLRINVQAVLGKDRILITVPYDSLESLVKNLRRATDDIVTWPEWRGLSAAIAAIYDDMLLNERGAREAINDITSIIIKYQEGK